MSAPMRDFTHAELCEVLGIAPSQPLPEWLPYAVQKTRVAIRLDDGPTWHWGGARCCGRCDFGVDLRPGLDTQHPEPEARLRCPKCGYDGAAPITPPEAP